MLVHTLTLHIKSERDNMNPEDWYIKKFSLHVDDFTKVVYLPIHYCLESLKTKAWKNVICSNEALYQTSENKVVKEYLKTIIY